MSEGVSTRTLAVVVSLTSALFVAGRSWTFVGWPIGHRDIGAPPLPSGSMLDLCHAAPVWVQGRLCPPADGVRRYSIVTSHSK